MDRLYTRDEYMRRIEWLKTARRRYSITTDIIVGFPGETEEDFEQTLDLLDEVQYDSLFSFKYSPRPNTAALAMGDRVPEEEKQRRLAILQEKQRAIQIRRNAELIGACARCWWRAATRRSGQWIGRTSDNRTLNFTARRRQRRFAGGPVPAGARHALRPQLVGGRKRNCGVIEVGEGVMEVEMKIRGLMMDPVTNMPIVILKDVNGNTVLPIWVGVYEANAIALEIEKVVDAPAHDPRPDQEPAAGPEHRPAQGGGERAEGRHLLRRDLAGSRRRPDQRGFPPQRRAGPGAAPGLPDLRGRDAC